MNVPESVYAKLDADEGAELVDGGIELSEPSVEPLTFRVGNQIVSVAQVTVTYTFEVSKDDGTLF